MGHDKGAHRPCSLHHEDQGGCPARAQVLGVDWWLHLVITEHLPADVDLQGRVRRVWPNNCPQEVLLSAPWTRYSLVLESSFARVVFAGRVFHKRWRVGWS